MSKRKSDRHKKAPKASNKKVAKASIKKAVVKASAKKAVKASASRPAKASTQSYHDGPTHERMREATRSTPAEELEQLEQQDLEQEELEQQDLEQQDLEQEELEQQDLEQQDLEQETPAPDQVDTIQPLLTSTVQGQVIDTAGNQWSFAIVQFSLFLPSGQKPVDLTTGLVIPNPAPIICDSTGNFSATLQNNSWIVPLSLWRITIFPFNNQFNGQTLEPFKVGGAMNLSATIAANLKPHIDPALILPMSNSGSVGQSTLNGSVYYDVKLGELLVRDPATAAYKNVGPALPPLVEVENIEINGNNSSGLIGPANGCLIGWNVSNGLGETDFINSPNGLGGGTAFYWFNVAPGMPITSTTVPLMSLDTEPVLSVRGGVRAAAPATVNPSQPGILSCMRAPNDATQIWMVIPGAANEHVWAIESFPNALQMSSYADDGVTKNTFWQADRAGAVVTGITVTGNFTVTGGTKAFKIHHPAKPDRWLIHACLEGPENAVFYRGEGKTINGRAEISLPDYFESLTLPSDRTVQLTIMVDDAEPVFGGQIAAGRVTNGKFKVYSTDPAARFYWEVKAIRRDLDRLAVEPEKSQEERNDEAMR
jgi:hypothetical protein